MPQQSVSSASSSRPVRLDWVDALRALALIGVLLNHLVEAFGPGPWFTNPGVAWPPLGERLHALLPHDPSPVIAGIRLLGWLGDSAPGVYILLSGLVLTLGTLRQSSAHMDVGTFYRRRLLRIFPLYIAMHLVVLGTAAFLPGDQPTFLSWRTAASLVGFRGLPSLFFYISPAWWFVWVILQLYAVYPLLWRGLERLGPWRFFAACVAITVASRGIVLLIGRDVFPLMTGMFFGTRLAEFAAGMVLAELIAGRSTVPAPSMGMITLASALSYSAGIAASMVIPGTLVSNLLVTLGLSGIFYAVWWVVLAPVPVVARAVVWLGGVSYAVYLLHQPFLLWTAIPLHGHPAAHLVAAVVVLILSVPAAVAIERVVSWIERKGPWRRAAIPRSPAAFWNRPVE